MSDAPSGSSAVAVMLNWWESVASVYVSIVWFSGAEFEIALDDEFSIATEPVHVVAVAVCSQMITSVALKNEDANVLAVSPEIAEPFQNHLHVLAPSFSVSLSASDHVPGLHVSVDVVVGEPGVMLGDVSDALFGSGYVFVESEVIAWASEVSLKLMLKDANVGAVLVQLYQIVNVFALVELDMYEHEPALMFSSAKSISANPSASSADAFIVNQWPEVDEFSISSIV